MGRARAAHMGRASAVNTGRAQRGCGPCARVAVGRTRTVHVGHAPLCNWAEREFGPVALKLIFLFSEYIQILVNLKFCLGFI
jgi:hypothetical protein